MPTRKAKTPPMIRDRGGPRQEMPVGGEQPHATRWTAQLDAMLGQVPDLVVAKAAGCSTESVRRRRARLGVPAFRPVRHWTPAADKLLGRFPDEQVAAKLGVTEVAVRIRRHRLGITKS